MKANYGYYLGVDVGKEAHQACALDSAGQMLFNLPVENREQAIDDVLSKVGSDCLVIVDQKNNIGVLVIRRARLKGLDVAYLPGLSANRASALFPGDAKTDKREAYVIARTAFGIPGSLLSIAEEDSRTEKLRRLSSQREALTSEGTRSKNRLRALLLESNPAFESAIKLGKLWHIKLLAFFGGPWQILDAGRRRFRSWVEKTPYADADEADRLWEAAKSATRVSDGQIEAERIVVKSMANRILAIEAEVKVLSKIIDHELRDDATYQALLTLPGVGPATASLLALTIDITNFKDHNALAMYTGLAPKNRQSGKSISSVSASNMGNKALKNLLIFTCTSLIGKDNYYGNYYAACKQRGMKHNQALKAVARKRLKLIYAIMRDVRPYVA
jgi:transposase